VFSEMDWEQPGLDRTTAASGFDRSLLFRFVGHLPGADTSASSCH